MSSGVSCSLARQLRCVMIFRGFSASSHVSCQHRHAVDSSTDLTEARRTAYDVSESDALVAGQEDEARAVLPAPVI